MKTKKLLVSFNRKTGDTSNDFLVAFLEEKGFQLCGLKSKDSFTSGVMVYVGQEVTANDLFARLVDSGRRIRDVEQTLRALEDYLQMLQDFRVGNVVGIRDDAAGWFSLTKLANVLPRNDYDRKVSE